MKLCRDPSSADYIGGTLRYNDSDALDFLLKTVPNLKQIIRGKRILDYGCGWGWQAALMVREGAREVVGIEIVAAAREKARRRAGQCGFSGRITESGTVGPAVLMKGPPGESLAGVPGVWAAMSVVSVYSGVPLSAAQDSGSRTSAHHQVAGYVPVHIEETFHFRDGPDVPQRQQNRDVAQGFVARQRRGENARVGGDAQVRQQKRPRQAKDIRSGGQESRKRRAAP